MPRYAAIPSRCSSNSFASSIEQTRKSQRIQVSVDHGEASTVHCTDTEGQKPARRQRDLIFLPIINYTGRTKPDASDYGDY